MCGIAGLIDRQARLGEADLAARVRAMTDAIAHRGPDGDGVWTDAACGIGLGHRRLAIIDLSPLGAQPMESADGRYVATYNGEIYNFAELRAELEAAGVAFRGHSDTEVVVEGFARWGVEATITRCQGMFAWAVWDRRTRVLRLIRDRLGVKPLYYAHDGARLIFASELKALRALAEWRPTLDRAALAAYARLGYVPAPRTIYHEARKLPAGHILEWAEGAEPRLSAYWDARGAAVAGRARWNESRDETETLARLEALLEDCVAKRLVSDVPLGAFLSGGIDSSLVVALMRKCGPAKTFTIGFDEKGYDEAAHAKAIAAHLGTEHTELYVSPAHALGVVPKLADMYDEPFADSSQIPTFLVSEMTRKHVTVALSGDGGDELFAGYNRYVWADRLWGTLARVPAPLRAAAAAIAARTPSGLADAAARLLPEHHRPARPHEKLAKMAEILRLDGIDAVYRRLVSQWPDPGALVPGGAEPDGPLFDPSLAAEFPEPVARMQAIDAATYLPDDILVKVDRATMAVGLEGREPLLDHRLYEFAWSLPPEFKLRDGVGKWPLRQILVRHVPRELFERPKMGFGVPIDSWLRGPLRDWAEDLLDERAMKADGLLAPAPIRAAWAQHLSGARENHYPLWTVLMFQAWRRRWL
ncbi:MAG: asparagine synthase (glutamine-hydrolyzing) [Azospirillum sp.]|nr:asparagine synthase (glutamine-hydrolyzing) [Azospirillum sp.]